MKTSRPCSSPGPGLETTALCRVPRSHRRQYRLRLTLIIQLPPAAIAGKLNH
uniref:Uncharacterized protein n=1 Tax=Anguilla anguilla TaxID=7936 RepID=A0A0E9VLX0_ANGAN